MGMHLADMKRFASEDPASRKNQTLPGAHLPARGFYRIKSANASQNQRQPTASWKVKVLSWLPFWSAVPQQPVDSDQSAALAGSLAKQSDDSSADSSATVAGNLARQSENSTTDGSVIQTQP